MESRARLLAGFGGLRELLPTEKVDKPAAAAAAKKAVKGKKRKAA